MLTAGFWHHVMMETEDDLRAEVADQTKTAEEHDALAEALHEREAAHEAADHLAIDHDRWNEVRSHTAEYVEMESTSAAMKVAS